ncbi:hypothetical protein ABJI51_37760 [Amycolatopsis sp. NEAU-NG30]|uniref:Integral membrane protein n=1 Tax=Amycolatopsis melonis TaxID=3156488 RepID=A0ABV0LRC4_9PSEU
MNETMVQYRPSRVPFALAVTFSLLLGLLALAAAAGGLDLDDAAATTFGAVLRTVLAVVGLCCLVGVVLLALSRSAGRIWTAVAGALALALPVLVSAAFAAPADAAMGVRQAGGLLVLVTVTLFGLLTMVHSLRRDTRYVITTSARAR